MLLTCALFLSILIDGTASQHVYQYLSNNGCPTDYVYFVSEPEPISGLLTLQIKCNGLCAQQPVDSVFNLPSETQITNTTRFGCLIIDNVLMPRFPSNICQYSLSLLILDVSFNRMSMPLTGDMLHCLTSLQFFNSSFNFVSKIGEGAFDHLTALVSLDLSNNQLTSLSSTLFAFRLPNLQALYLQNNFLLHIDIWFLYMPRILYVNLSFNKISQFVNQMGWTPENRSDGMGTPDTIDLSSNYLTSFGDSLLAAYNISNPTRLAYFIYLMRPVSLANNPLSCTCSSSYNMLNYFQTLPETIGISSHIIRAACSTPLRFRNRSIFSFQNPGKCMRRNSFLSTRLQMLKNNFYNIMRLLNLKLDKS